LKYAFKTKDSEIVGGVDRLASLSSTAKYTSGEQTGVKQAAAYGPLATESWTNISRSIFFITALQAEVMTIVVAQHYQPSMHHPKTTLLQQNRPWLLLSLRWAILEVAEVQRTTPMSTTLD
jgi:hypothetical protein